MTYKILHNKLDLNKQKYFMFYVNIHNTRGNSMKLDYRVKSMYELHHYFFFQNVIPIWNNLENEIVTSASVTTFKKKISGKNFDKYLRNK